VEEIRSGCLTAARQVKMSDVFHEEVVKIKNRRRVFAKGDTGGKKK
jgi:hypothetical protein